MSIPSLRARRSEVATAAPPRGRAWPGIVAVLLTAGCRPPLPAAPASSSSPPVHEAGPPNVCRREFDALRRLVEHGYAGWDDKRDRLGEVHIDGATAHVGARADATADDDAAGCSAALRPWLAMFEDGHLTLIDLAQPRASGPVEHATGEPVAFVPISARTVVLRVPSFDDPAPVAAVIDAHRLEIRRAERLIVDLRGNAGGVDPAWAPLMDFVQSRPYTVIGVDVRVGDDNAAAWERAADELPASLAEVAAQMRDVAARMRAVRQPWLELTPDRVETREAVRLPRYVDIVHDGACARACEQFVLEASASDKVTTFGSHTAGVLDYADVRTAVLPSGARVLAWPTTRSRRLPSAPVDGVGLLPEVAIEPAALRSLDAAGLARRVAAPR